MSWALVNKGMNACRSKTFAVVAAWTTGQRASRLQGDKVKEGRREVFLRCNTKSLQQLRVVYKKTKTVYAVSKDYPFMSVVNCAVSKKKRDASWGNGDKKQAKQAQKRLYDKSEAAKKKRRERRKRKSLSIETPGIEASGIETSDIEKSCIETSGIETSAIETSGRELRSVFTDLRKPRCASETKTSGIELSRELTHDDEPCGPDADELPEHDPSGPTMSLATATKLQELDREFEELMPSPIRTPPRMRTVKLLTFLKTNRSHRPMFHICMDLDNVV